MNRWAKSTAGEVLGALLFFALAGAMAFAFSCFLRISVAEMYGKTASDFLLMTTQCALGLAGMTLPVLCERKLGLQLPPFIYTLYYAFLLCAVFLGEILSFYYLVPAWDILLHLFSGAMLCALGFVAADFLNRSSCGAASPALLAAFAFCFSLAAGAVWEIYEYIMDGMLHMNMQKFADARLVAYTGRQALDDTMQDVMADALSALATAFAGYALMRKKRAQR